MSILSRALSSSRRKFNAPPDRNRQPHHQLMTCHSGEEQTISDDSTEIRMDRDEIPSSSSSTENEPANLDRFLECTTPVVRARHLPKTIIRRTLGRTIEIEHPPYFVLEDLWDAFNEWGTAVAVPLVVYGTDLEEYRLTQYYVPSLSGIQLYIHPKRPPTQRTPGGETSSDGGNNAVRWARSGTEIADENITRLNRLSPANRPFQGQWGVETKPLGELVFEYIEEALPSKRKDLCAKISTLAASNFPALMTYRSCDLSPSSWVSVFWFPLNTNSIENSPNLKFDTCFLTYHCLSTESPSTSIDGPPFRGFNVRNFHGAEMPSKLPLSISAFAFYKFRIFLWLTPEALPRANSLLLESKNWLKRLRVHHKDYVIFAFGPYATT